ncbi:MAG: ATP-binding protein [Clostridiales bacterium]|nr:ATP-binding protein [Clostridiales bacterium]
MLTKIITENFKVFKDRSTMDLRNSNIGMIFGPDSQGKSTLLGAVQWLLVLAVHGKSVRSAMTLNLTNPKSETAVEYHFLFNGKNTRYTLKYSPVTLQLKEVLVSDGQLVFERIDSNIKISPLCKAKLDKVALKADEVFLHYALNHLEFEDDIPFNALKSYLMNAYYINPMKEVIISYGSVKTHANFYVEKNGTERLNVFLKENKLGLTVTYAHEGKNSNINIKFGNEETKTLFVTHDATGMTLPFTEEAYDTQTLLNLLPTFFQMQDQAGLLLIDNLSKALHPKTELLLIETFKKTAKHSNLIFVSDNPMFLMNKKINANAVFITYYDEKKGAHIKPLSQHKQKVAIQGAAPDIEKITVDKIKH